MIRPRPVRQLRLPLIRDACEPVALRFVDEGLPLLQAGGVVALTHPNLLDMHPRKHARAREVAARYADLERIVVAARDPHVLDTLVLEVLEHGPTRAERLRRIKRQQVASANHRVEPVDIDAALVALERVGVRQVADHAVALEAKHLHELVASAGAAAVGGLRGLVADCDFLTRVDVADGVDGLGARGRVPSVVRVRGAAVVQARAG